MNSAFRRGRKKMRWSRGRCAVKKEVLAVYAIFQGEYLRGHGRVILSETLSVLLDLRSCRIGSPKVG